MANNSIGATPILRISQLIEETEQTISGDPSNTWFTIVNSDIMKTRRISLNTLLKFLAVYFYPSASISYLTLQGKAGITINGSTSSVAYMGNTVIISDIQTANIANSSYIQANLSYDTANSSFKKANSALDIASSSFLKANSSYNHANSAFNKANSYFTITTDSGIRLTGGTTVRNVTLGDSFLISDSLTYGIANDARDKSYTPFTINTSGGIRGGGSIQLGGTLNFDAIPAYNHANSSYAYANGCLLNPAINYITANGITAYSNNRYIIIGTDLIVTLQPNPKFNTYINFTNMGTSKTNMIKTDGATRIHGLSPGENLRLDLSNVSVTLCYVDADRGWVIV